MEAKERERGILKQQSSQSLIYHFYQTTYVPPSPHLQETEEEDAQSPTPEPESVCGATKSHDGQWPQPPWAWS